MRELGGYRGQIVVGTDSRTCTTGAVGAFGFGVSATDIAASWYNRQVLVTVPEVLTVNLTGRLRDGVCAEDVVLSLGELSTMSGGCSIDSPCCDGARHRRNASHRLVVGKKRDCAA